MQDSSKSFLIRDLLGDLISRHHKSEGELTELFIFNFFWILKFQALRFR